MRYRVVANVSGTLRIEKPVSVERDGILFEFFTTEDGVLNKIAVSLQVPQNKVANFTNSIKPATENSYTSISVGGDRELHELLVTELQALEAHLSFGTVNSLKGIDWLNLENEEFIAESPEEKALLSFTGFTTRLDYPNPSFSLSERALINTIEYMPFYAALTIAKAFYRQGVTAFREFQYVNAFYYFFFIIEDFYANGKFGMRDVLTEFQKSAEFLKVSENALNIAFEQEKHKTSLIAFFDEENCDATPEGLQKLLFHIRGNLHHYYSKSPKTRGTPFNQGEYESVALVAMTMVSYAIGLREAAISSSIREKLY